MIQSERQTYCKNRRVFRHASMAPSALLPLRIAQKQLSCWWPTPQRRKNNDCTERSNVLNKLPKSQHAKAKRALQEIWMAEKGALGAFDVFVETWAKRSLARTAHLGRHSRRIRGTMLRME